MKKIILTLTIFFVSSSYSFINAEQTNIDIARELCCNALCEGSRENCDAAFVFGKNTLDNLEIGVKIEDVNHLKGLLCTACINCNLNNLETLVTIADEVIKFKRDSAYLAEIHVINAWLIKSMLEMINHNFDQALSYIRIADLLSDNYKTSKLFEKEMHQRMKNMIKLQREFISTYQK